MVVSVKALGMPFYRQNFDVKLLLPSLFGRIFFTKSAPIIFCPKLKKWKDIFPFRKKVNECKISMSTYFYLKKIGINERNDFFQLKIILSAILRCQSQVSVNIETTNDIKCRQMKISNFSKLFWSEIGQQVTLSVGGLTQLDSGIR